MSVTQIRSLDVKLNLIIMLVFTLRVLVKNSVRHWQTIEIVGSLEYALIQDDPTAELQNVKHIC